MKTTVICAVWSKDPNRRCLVLKHHANLMRQTVKTRAIYIFDDGDQPPLELRNNSVSVSHPLSIYEAWNVGLTLVRTPYVMNLNLDDRLSQDAIEAMENEMERGPYDIVGGDWEVCFGLAPDESAFNSREIAVLPFYPEWPPVRDRKCRLGSGDGSRGTLGPAVMWRMTNHLIFPRYPYRTSTDYLIKSVADGIWWAMLKQKGLRFGRIKRIIGRYLSNPSVQAEFRQKNELEVIGGAPISLL